MNNYIYEKLSDFFSISIEEFKLFRGVISKDSENDLKKIIDPKLKNNDLLCLLLNYYDMSGLNKDIFIATLNKVFFDLNVPEKLSINTRKVDNFLESQTFNFDKKTTYSIYEKPDLSSQELFLSQVILNLNNIKLLDPRQDFFIEYFFTIEAIENSIDLWYPILKEAKSSLKSLRLHISLIHSRYKKIYNTKSSLIKDLEFQSFIINNFETIDSYKILESDFSLINKTIFFDKAKILDPLKMQESIRTEDYSKLKSDLLNQLISSKNIDINFSNIKTQLYVITSLLYTITRMSIYKDKKYKENPLIESIINFCENAINYFVSNHKLYSSDNFHRVLSLISFKNNLKIRYNIDNNIFQNEDLIDNYLNEIKFIIDNNYHVIELITMSKAIDELAKIQNYYNYFSINKSINDIYTKELLKLTEVFDSIPSYKDLIENEHFVRSDTDEFKSIKVYIHEHKYRKGLEISRAFLESILFSNKSFVGSNKKKLEETEDALKFIEDDWNKFDESDVKDELTIVNNNIEPNFIYKLKK